MLLDEQQRKLVEWPVCPPGGAIDYFTNSTPDHIKHTADQQHEAIWPFVQALIKKHFDWTSTPIVIDGWHLRPQRIRALDSDAFAALWIWIDPHVLEQRERNNNMDFYNQSPDPEKMLSNFMARSLWFNDLMRTEAQAHGFPVLEQDGTRTVESLCDEMLRADR